MGYYNDRRYDRGGYGRDNRGYDRGYDRGYNDRGDDRGGYGRGDYPPREECPFSIGQKLRHKYTGTELFMIREGREQIECRTPDMRTEWFYIHELEPAEPAKAE